MCGVCVRVCLCAKRVAKPLALCTYMPHAAHKAGEKKRSRIKSGQKNPYNEIANNANAQQTHSHESRCKMRPVELTNQKKKKKRKDNKKERKT